MAHIFDAKKWAKLDSPERRKMLPPEEILQKFKVKAGDTVADVGCGIGYFSLPASTLVGPTGEIIALDISADMLAHLQEKVQSMGVANITIVKTSEAQLATTDEAADVVLAFFILHEAPDQQAFVAELDRILKPGGRLALIDWEKRETPAGPPVAHRVDKEMAVKLLQQAGFAVTELEVGTDFYGLQAIKSGQDCY